MIFTHYHTHTRFWKGWTLWIKLICHLLCSLTWLALYLFFNNSTNNHKETDTNNHKETDTASYFFVTRDFLFKNARHHNSSDCSRLAYKPPPELEFNFYELLVRYVAAMSQLIFIYLPKFKHVPPFVILVLSPTNPNRDRHLQVRKWCSLQRTNSKCCGIEKPNTPTRENPVHRTTAGSLSES